MADKEEYQALLEFYKKHLNYDKFTEGAQFQFWDDIKSVTKNKENNLEGLKGWIHTLETQEVYDKLIEKTKIHKKTHELTPQILILLIKKERGQATELIVKYILERQIIFTIRNDTQEEMWIYDDGIYKPQGKTYIQEICRRILGDIFTTSILNNVIVKIQADTFISTEELFKEPPANLIPVKNGVIDINTKEILSFKPEWRFFNKLPIVYNPNTECIKIKEFFKQVLEDEDSIKVMQELFGYLLVRNHKYHKFFVFNGEGRNGKGITLQLMRKFIGPDNCCEVSIDELQNDPFAIANLFKKMANLSGDLSKKGITNSSRLKMTTGEDFINANRKFQSYVGFVSYAKQIFACNEIPITYDNTYAFFDRIVMLMFPFTFLTEKELEISKDINAKQRDPHILEKISGDDELSGLLNWALEGYAILKENGDFSVNKTTEEVKKQWIRKSNSFEAFFDDNLVYNANEQVEKVEIRIEYARYCRLNKLKPVSDKRINYSMEGRCIWSERDQSASNRPMVWKCVTFKNRQVNMENIE